jgi:multicomponent Na+:H+ antiporter subunit D
MIDALPPGVLLIAGALVVPLLRGTALKLWVLALPLLSFWHQVSLPAGHQVEFAVFEYVLQPVRVDGLSAVFGGVFHLAAFLGCLYALHVRDRLQHVAALMYAGSAIAAVHAGDLLTLFVFWEGTALASAILVFARREPRSSAAGLRYLIIQVGSGVLLLSGAVLQVHETGSLRFEAMALSGGAAGLIFVAFGIKAAFPLLHNWMQDAYPEATVTGAVFMSAFTTKLAVYALARGFPGVDVLIPIGAVMTVFPLVYAAVENDLRRVLAYLSNNQVGFMVVAVGIGTEAAIDGVCAHAIAHVIYQGVLFMATGALLYRTGTARASELGGLGRSMPYTTAFTLVAAASISAFPLTSGFVAKSFVVDQAASAHLTVIFLVLLFASAGVFVTAGIKIPYTAFFGRDRGLRVAEAPFHMLLAMGLGAALCVAMGVYPEGLYALLPYPVDLTVYTPSHVVGQLQLLVFAALATALLLRAGVYQPALRGLNLDSDWIYRRLLPKALRSEATRLAATRDRAMPAIGALVRGVVDAPARGHRGGWLGEPWPSGTTALWAAVLLGLYLVLYYI